MNKDGKNTLDRNQWRIVIAELFIHSAKTIVSMLTYIHIDHLLLNRLHTIVLQWAILTSTIGALVLNVHFVVRLVTGCFHNYYYVLMELIVNGMNM